MRKLILIIFQRSILKLRGKRFSVVSGGIITVPRVPLMMMMGWRRRHSLENKPWKEKLNHQESSLDKKLSKEASLDEENERECECVCDVE